MNHLLYENNFINQRLDGIKNDEKQDLFNYLDEIEKERSNELRKEKSKLQKLYDEPIKENIEIKKTLVNIDSRLRNKYPQNIKENTVHTLENIKYKIIESIRLIKKIDGTPTIYTTEIILSEYLLLSSNIKIWLTLTTWTESNILKNIYNIENKLTIINKFDRKLYIYIVNDTTHFSDLTDNKSYNFNSNLTYFQLIDTNEKLKILEIEKISSQNKLRITFKLNTSNKSEINKYINKFNNLSKIKLSIAPNTTPSSKFTEYNNTKITIDKFENKYFFEIDTSSDQFKKDPFDESDITSKVTQINEYLRIDKTNINNITNNIDYTYFYINQITLFNNTSEIQITHPNHGFKTHDKISFNMNWENKLYRTGGLIYKFIVNNDKSKIRFYIESDLNNSIMTNQNYTINYNYLHQILKVNFYISIQLDLKYKKDNKTYFKLITFDNLKIESISDNIDNNTSANKNDISKFDLIQYYFEVNNIFDQFTLNEQTYTTIQDGRTSSEVDMISFSYNNCWFFSYDKKMFSNSNDSIKNFFNEDNIKYNKPFYSIKNNQKLYIFNYNHNLTYPINISGNIVRIQTIDNSNFTNSIKQLRFYTFNTNLRENLKIYFDYDSKNTDYVPYTFLKLQKDKPYTIYNVNYYTTINKVNRSNDINKKYQYFDINLYDGDLKLDNENNLLNKENIVKLNSNYDTTVVEENNSNIVVKVNNITSQPIETITPNITFNVNKKPLTNGKSYPTDENNIVNISNILKEKININSIQVFKPYKPKDENATEKYLIQNNYIKQIEAKTYSDTNEEDSNVTILFGFKLTFQNDVNLTPNFDIRDYINNGIVLRYISKKLDILNNLNKPFTVLYEDDDLKFEKNDKTVEDLTFSTDLEKKSNIYIRFSDDIYWGQFQKSWNSLDNALKLEYTTCENNGFWQPANSIWLQVKINIDNGQDVLSSGFITTKTTNGYNNISNLQNFLQENEKVKINLNLDGINNNRSYIAKNISKQYTNTPSSDNKSYNIFLINLQVQDINILSEYISGRYYELITPGEVNIFEIEKSSPINYLNRHMFTIDLIPNSNYPHYFGNSYEEFLKNNVSVVKLLSIGNIPDEFINADYPQSNNRKNGFHKIEYIDENNYKIITNSNIITYYDNNLFINNNYYNEVNNKIYINPDLNCLYYKTNSSSDYTKLDSTSIKLNIQKINKIEQGFLKQNYYIYKFGRTFENITEIKMISSEFPNSSQVINNTINNNNNKIYWRLLDDGPYEYEATLEPGNYSANSLKLEIQDKMNSTKRSFNNNKLQEIIVIIDTAKSLIEFRSFNKITLNNKLSIAKNTNRLEITFDEDHYINNKDIIIISNSLSVGGINASLINKEHFAYVITTKQIYINLTADATKTDIEKGGKKLIVRKLIPMQILWDKSNTFGKLLGFNRSGEFNYVQPPFMNVISNIEYNKYNDSNLPNIFEISGENYILILNNLLSNINNNSEIKDIFAKILLPSKSGSWVFNSFLSKSVKFKYPLKKLSELEFKFCNFLGNLYEFNGLDHSFTLEITEEISKKEIKTYNSKDI